MSIAILDAFVTPLTEKPEIIQDRRVHQLPQLSNSIASPDGLQTQIETLVKLNQPLTLDRSDAAAVKMFLSARKLANSSLTTSYGSIDLKKANAVDLMAARIAKHQNLTDEEDAETAAAFDRFKHSIDLDRPLGQKLYS